MSRRPQRSREAPLSAPLPPRSSAEPSSPRFLVLRGGAIGDFILTLPALQLLRDRWPAAYIELVGYPHVAELARAGGLVDRVDSLDRACISELFVPRADLDPGLAGHIRSFDVVLSYLYDPDDLVKDNLVRAGAPQVICGSPLVEQGHAIDRLLEPLGELALFADRAHARLVLDAPSLETGRAWLAGESLQRPLALHPGSGNPDKNWPVGNFVELAGRAASAGWCPFFILGEADAGLAPTLSGTASRFPVLHGRSLVEVGGVLAGCAAYVGNDSGITHLAAAVGIPVRALFGPSPSEHWAPRGPAVRLLHSADGRMSGISVEDVSAALFSPAS